MDIDKQIQEILVDPVKLKTVLKNVKTLDLVDLVIEYYTLSHTLASDYNKLLGDIQKICNSPTNTM